MSFSRAACFSLVSRHSTEISFQMVIFTWNEPVWQRGNHYKVKKVPVQNSCMIALTNLEYQLRAGSTERAGTELLLIWLCISGIRNANWEYGSGWKSPGEGNINKTPLSYPMKSLIIARWILDYLWKKKKDVSTSLYLRFKDALNYLVQTEPSILT